jgi:hypothetical protein
MYYTYTNCYNILKDALNFSIGSKVYNIACIFGSSNNDAFAHGNIYLPYTSSKYATAVNM